MLVLYIRKFTEEIIFLKNQLAILDYSFTEGLMKELKMYCYPVRKMKGESKALK